MIIGIPYSSWDTPPQIGDEIAALGESGQLVGKSVFTGGFIAITIFGDDYYTPNIVENLADGEEFTIDVWSATKSTKKQYKFENWQQGNRYFKNKQIGIVGANNNEEQVERDEMKIEVFPNPSRGVLNIAVISDQLLSATIHIVDILGKEVFCDEIEIIIGKQIQVLDISTLVSGSYTLFISTDKLLLQKNIVITK